MFKKIRWHPIKLAQSYSIFSQCPKSGTSNFCQLLSKYIELCIPVGQINKKSVSCYPNYPIFYIYPKILWLFWIKHCLSQCKMFLKYKIISLPTYPILILMVARSKSGFFIFFCLICKMKANGSFTEPVYKVSCRQSFG